MSLDNLIPQQNIEMEQAALGSMLISAEAVEAVAEILDAPDFYREAHGVIFDAMISLRREHEPVDLISVREWLRERDRLEECKGEGYLRTLINSVVTPSNAPHYAKVVKEKAVLRSLKLAADRIAALSFSHYDDIDELLAEAELVYNDATQIRGNTNAEGMKALVSSAFDDLERRARERKIVTGISTGIDELDYLTCGFQPESLTIIGARPSQGKTALAAHFALTAAKAGHPVYIASQEMSKRAMTLRLIQSYAHVDGHRMRTGFMSDEDWEKTGRACSRLSDFPITIAEQAMSLTKLRAECRRMARTGLDLVVVDYLQLMKSEGRKENRTAEVSALAEGLHDLSVELKCAIIALSQLSRDVEKRTDKRPILADLRDSGQVEAAADLVIFPYTAPKPAGTERPAWEEMELIVAKQRDGMVGSARAMWFRECTAFANVAKEYGTPQPSQMLTVDKLAQVSTTTAQPVRRTAGTSVPEPMEAWAESYEEARG